MPRPSDQPRDPAGRFGRKARSDSEANLSEDLQPELLEVLESAARLQKLVPDAVLVGGSAAAYYARHRVSHDHDHVLVDLRERFEVVLDALEREPEWTTNRVTPGKIILGQLGEIEAGVRQLIRKRPLEVEDIELPSGSIVRVPTREEALRVKAFLIVKRNQVRDYLDVAALSNSLGSEQSAAVLSGIDEFYADESKDGRSVASQLVRQLAEPRPKDTRSLAELPRYKGLSQRWQDWSAVVVQVREVAAHMLTDEGGDA